MLLSFFLPASRSCAAVIVDPGSFLQILSEMSWDTLLLLVGLAFVGVAVVGNITGKIAPGKEGRIAAAIVGIIAIGAGVWYHGVLHSFKITGMDVITPDAQSAKCPITIPLQAVVDAHGSGDVIYNFQFSSGNASSLQHAAYSQSGSQILSGTWQVRDSVPDAWVQLNIAAPTKRVSNPSQHFSITCQTDQPPAVAAQPAPAEPAVAAQPAPQAAAQPIPPAAAPAPALPAAAAPAAIPQPAGPASAAAQPAGFKVPVKMATQLVTDVVDHVVIDAVSPPVGSYLKRGAPIPLGLTVSYNLASADTAILSISTAQAYSSPAGCAGSGELVDTVEVPIQRGKRTINVHLTWSGDTGKATKGHVYGSGYLGFTPMFWRNDNGQRGARIAVFGTNPQDCYRFGP